MDEDVDVENLTSILNRQIFLRIRKWFCLKNLKMLTRIIDTNFQVLGYIFAQFIKNIKIGRVFKIYICLLFALIYTYEFGLVRINKAQEIFR